MRVTGFLAIRFAVTTRHILTQQWLWQQSLSQHHLQYTFNCHWLSWQVALPVVPSWYLQQCWREQMYHSSLHACLTCSWGADCHCKQHTLLLHILRHPAKKLSQCLCMPQQSPRLFSVRFATPYQTHTQSEQTLTRALAAQTTTYFPSMPQIGYAMQVLYVLQSASH